ncbi:hypothetical protein MMC18_004518 [Xylographa bjoerkii]|nr:hypothetical protein [Xylographa bjoerkii]
MESAVPPSYEQATTRDYWTIIAQYIRSPDLCSVSLVSKRWHAIFAPCLWGNPASHFGTENDRVYVALTRFKRTLPRVRLAVRQLTHTLQLPPAQSEIYDGPHPEWLRDVLEQLPHLQSLIVSQLPFFDHSALSVLRQQSTERSSAEDFPIFLLRLLIATRCNNTTSASLAEAFLHWPNLVFLDLSDTIAARDNDVLSGLHFMNALQILKLRNIQLKDENLEVLADAIGIRVRSLDIRDNKITDTSVRTLLNKCVHTTRDIQASQSRTSRGLNGAGEEDWPSGVARPDSHLLNEFRGEDIDERFLRRLTQGVVDRLPSEDLPSTGLTHLYIANNFITVEAVASLLRSQNLHLLDAGTADTVKALGVPRTRSSFSHPPSYSMYLPGAEKLAPVLERFASKNLTYLRLHHAVVTEAAVYRDDMLLPTELPAEDTEVVELDTAESARYELDGAAPMYELAASGTATPRYELPGDSMHVLVSPAIGRPPVPSFEELAISGVRRGSAFAPEVLEGPDLAEDEEEPVVLTATGLGRLAQAVNGVGGRLSGNGRDPMSAQPLNKDGMTGEEENTDASIALIEQQRRDLRAHSSENPQGLFPGALPALQTLILTDVPCMDKTQHVVNSLKKFIDDCAMECKLATMQASLEHPLLYIPGKPRSTHLQHRKRELFGLKRIVLEMAPPLPATSFPADVPASPRTPTQGTWSLNRSSTEDTDTEAFWVAQENDFSFFGDEECGLPAAEPGMHFPMSALSEKMVLPMNSLHFDGLPTLQQPEKPNPEQGLDVVQELAKYRKEKKAMYENALNFGKRFVDGYWPGEVKVVRMSGSKDSGGRRRGGSVDWYGNYNENGIYR